MRLQLRRSLRIHRRADQSAGASATHDNPPPRRDRSSKAVSSSKSGRPWCGPDVLLPEPVHLSLQEALDERGPTDVARAHDQDARLVADSRSP